MEGSAPEVLPLDPDEVEDVDADEGDPTKRRERSSIEFPYGDLADAEEIALGVHEHYGLQATIDQLAAALRQTSTSGAFRSKLSTARIFGLVETERGMVTLTDLGRKIADASQRPAARAEAFLRVPLYGAIHRKFAGHLLPPPAALEREMAGFGVAKKQTPRARQAFERSAAQAGFFSHGPDRLVAPPMGGAPETRPIPASDAPGKGGGGGGGGFRDLHPFVEGLLQTLPDPESNWGIAERVKWLRTAANIFDLIYAGDDGEITVAELKRGRERRTDDYDDRR